MLKRLTVLLAISGTLALSAQTAAEAKNFYVNQNGDNSDGLTVKTAWNELEHIDWTKLSAGDKILVAQGIYRTTLRINFRAKDRNPGNTVTISNQGKVVIDGTKSQVGIDFGRSRGVCVQSDSCNNLIIRNCGATAINFGQELAAGNTIWRLQVSNSGLGLSLGGSQNFISRCDIHDNKVNVLLIDGSNPSPRQDTRERRHQFFECWIHNTVNSGGDGIIGNSQSTLPYFSLEGCAIGPNLRNGIALTGRNTFFHIFDSLFINCTDNNVIVNDYDRCGINFFQNTSYMTKLNPVGKAHNALNINSGDVYLGGIMYGGNLKLQAPNVVFTAPPQGIVYFNTTGSPTPGQNVDPLLKDVLPEAFKRLC
jgi:hypothetical protein